MERERPVIASRSAACMCGGARELVTIGVRYVLEAPSCSATSPAASHGPTSKTAGHDDGSGHGSLLELDASSVVPSGGWVAFGRGGRREMHAVVSSGGTGWRTVAPYRG